MKLSRNTKRRIVFYGGIAVVTAGALAFTTWMPGKSFRGIPPPLDAREAAYESRLRRDVAALAGTIGERNTDRASALHDAADMITESLKTSGFTPMRRRFIADGVTCENVEVEIRGRSKPTEIVVIGAHYDSAQGAPGADDNASGTAAVLALARTFRDRPVERTVRFVLFANEEPPYFWTESMGSLVYAREARARGDDVVAMISLESIGYFDDAPGSQHYPFPIGLLYPSTGNFVAFVGDLGSRSLTRRAIGAFRGSARVASEGAALPAAIPGVGWSDQWSFWQVGYRAVMITDTATFRNPSYHTANDRPATLDYPRFARAVAGTEDVIAELAR